LMVWFVGTGYNGASKLLRFPQPNLGPKEKSSTTLRNARKKG